MKRFFDMIAALTGLFVLAPVLSALIILVWLQDFCSPFYIAPRVGRGGRIFPMVKLRTMVIHADRSGVNSTGADDKRITEIGHIIRRFKLDEFMQLWNVLLGQMSLVGPRPQVKNDVDLYTDAERLLLTVRPGITDPASIVFSDEGDILAGSEDPDLKYNQVIRPWKSRLALLYVKKRNFFIDLWIIVLTVVAIFSRATALRGLQNLLRKIGADRKLLEVARRESVLEPYPPPGSTSIISSR
jgi:lipopolysaccharide/colanic/teichoic acid biosynthesis glycosyltransferase